jgi:phospholipid-binding lipoprotein MlaA
MKRVIILWMLICSSLCSCAQLKENPDPFEPINRSVYSFNQTLDAAIVHPLAEFYAEKLPSVLTDGVHNFFANIGEVSYGINHVLQFNMNYALGNFWRVMINSTLGILGFFDVAAKMGMPRHKAHFGTTLAIWGIEHSPYIVFPILGSMTMTDGPGRYLDMTMSPWSWFKESDFWRLYFVYGIDKRSNYLSFDGLLRDAIDPYVAVRHLYMQLRKREILESRRHIYKNLDMMNKVEEINKALGDTADEDEKLDIEEDSWEELTRNRERQLTFLPKVPKLKFHLKHSTQPKLSETDKVK